MRYTLRAVFRQTRLQQSLTQSALAARSGTSRVTIARLEAGSARDVRLGTISRVGEALKLEVAAVPLGGGPVLERHFAREREKVRRLERRLVYAVLAARLLAACLAEARALIAAARAAVGRWEWEHLCSCHYISWWRVMLAGFGKRVVRSLLERGDW
jgi:transcriptional regulator with XRE-family HTH domain